MTSTELYFALLWALIFGVAWCANRFLASASSSEQAYRDASNALYKANRDVAGRVRLDGGVR